MCVAVCEYVYVCVCWMGMFQAVVTAKEWGCVYNLCIIITAPVKSDGKNKLKISFFKLVYVSVYVCMCVFTCLCKSENEQLGLVEGLSSLVFTASAGRFSTALCSSQLNLSRSVSLPMSFSLSVSTFPPLYTNTSSLSFPLPCQRHDSVRKALMLGTWHGREVIRAVCPVM